MHDCIWILSDASVNDYVCNVLSMEMRFQEITAHSRGTGDRIRIGCKTNCFILIKKLEDSDCLILV